MAGRRDDKTTVNNSPRALLILTLVAVVGLGVGLYFALFYAGTDVGQGEVQRLFYLHLPSFTGAAAAFTATFIGGLLYLTLHRPRWEMLAAASAEVGLVLAGINVALGSIWARPIWNTWWTGDPRMTSSAIMLLTCAAYLLLRNGISQPNTRRWFSAAMAVLLMVVMLVSVVIVRVRTDTIHPVVIGPSSQNANTGLNMPASMATALAVNLAVWVGLFTPVLVGWRYRLEQMAQRRSSTLAQSSPQKSKSATPVH